MTHQTIQLHYTDAETFHALLAFLGALWSTRNARALTWALAHLTAPAGAAR